jgi:hypothetical protein
VWMALMCGLGGACGNSAAKANGGAGSGGGTVDGAGETGSAGTSDATAGTGGSAVGSGRTSGDVDANADAQVDASTDGVIVDAMSDDGSDDENPSSTSSCGRFRMPNPASTGLPNPPSYTTNADGTVTDNVTGLVWEGTVGPEPARAVAPCEQSFSDLSRNGGKWRAAVQGRRQRYEGSQRRRVVSRVLEEGDARLGARAGLAHQPLEPARGRGHLGVVEAVGRVVGGVVDGGAPVGEEQEGHFALPETGVVGERREGLGVGATDDHAGDGAREGIDVRRCAGTPFGAEGEYRVRELRLADLRRRERGPRGPCRSLGRFDPAAPVGRGESTWIPWSASGSEAAPRCRRRQ